MTLLDFAEYGSPICTGGCGLSDRAHIVGTLYLGVIHFADRRWSRRALRNLLLLVARREREADPGFINMRPFDWYYLYLDNVKASRMALGLGVRLPARLSRKDRLMCARIAAARRIALSRYPAVRAWVGDA